MKRALRVIRDATVFRSLPFPTLQNIYETRTMTILMKPAIEKQSYQRLPGSICSLIIPLYLDAPPPFLTCSSLSHPLFLPQPTRDVIWFGAPHSEAQRKL